MERKLEPGERGRIWYRSTRRIFEPGPRPQAELVVFLGLRGRMSYFIDGDLVQLGQYELMFVESGCSHFLVSEARDYDMVVLVFSPETLEKCGLPRPWESYQAEGGVSPRTVSFHEADYLHKLAGQLVGEKRPDVVDAGLAWWLHNATAAWLNAARQETARLHPGVAMALTAIQEDPSVEIGEIAKSVNLTGSRLGQLFRRQCGSSMQDYRAVIRFQLLEEIMKADPGKPLLTAAYEAGFGDYSNFFRAFKRHYKCSPRQFFKHTGSPALATDRHLSRASQKASTVLS